MTGEKCIKKSMMHVHLLLFFYVPVAIAVVQKGEGPTAGVSPGGMTHLGVLLLLPGWYASLSQGFPLQYVADTHLYTRVKRDKV